MALTYKTLWVAPTSRKMLSVLHLLCLTACLLSYVMHINRPSKRKQLLYLLSLYHISFENVILISCNFLFHPASRLLMLGRPALGRIYLIFIYLDSLTLLGLAYFILFLSNSMHHSMPLRVVSLGMVSENASSSICLMHSKSISCHTVFLRSLFIVPFLSLFVSFHLSTLTCLLLVMLVKRVVTVTHEWVNYQCYPKVRCLGCNLWTS